jgi:hypothetical protein
LTKMTEMCGNGNMKPISFDRNASSDTNNSSAAMATKKNLRTCPKGHQYYKSSDCPTCPICEEERKPKDGFLSLLSAPARRALEREGVVTLERLSQYSEKEVLQFHGMGPSSLPKLRSALKAADLTFKK